MSRGVNSLEWHSNHPYPSDTVAIFLFSWLQIPVGISTLCHLHGNCAFYLSLPGALPSQGSSWLPVQRPRTFFRKNTLGTWCPPHNGVGSCILGKTKHLPVAEDGSLIVVVHVTIHHWQVFETLALDTEYLVDVYTFELQYDFFPSWLPILGEFLDLYPPCIYLAHPSICWMGGWLFCLFSNYLQSFFLQSFSPLYPLPPVPLPSPTSFSPLHWGPHPPTVDGNLPLAWEIESHEWGELTYHLCR